MTSAPTVLGTADEHAQSDPFRTATADDLDRGVLEPSSLGDRRVAMAPQPIKATTKWRHRRGHGVRPRAHTVRTLRE